jgi:NAD(P)-dependent dehydrogenase (short-subunit alcohol dehydrogenase family)
MNELKVNAELPAEMPGNSSHSDGKSVNRFVGSVVVVTGGGSGIGRALVAALAERRARAIIVVDRDERTASETADSVNQDGLSMATAVAVDVANEDAIASLVRRVEREFGPIDFWFSNAGVNCGVGLGGSSEWETAIDVNLMAHVHAARHVLPGMEQRGAGGFVITASAAGLLSDMRNAPYTVTKHAVVGLAEWLAISVADGVTISCVCPEGVMTGMTRTDSKFAGSGIEFIEAHEVAGRTLDAVERGDFLVLTHPRTAEFELRRIRDRERWIEGMRKARTRSLGVATLFSIQ